MAGAAAAALLVHWLSVRLILGVPVPGRGRGFLETFVATTIGPSLLAVVVLALWRRCRPPAFRQRCPSASARFFWPASLC